MIRILIKNWWLLALRGVFALLFGMFAFSLRTMIDTWVLGAVARAGLVVIFGFLAFAAGLCTITAAMRGAGTEKSYLLLCDGIAICVGGAVILFAPRLDLIWLIYAVAVFAITVGILELLLARTLRRHVPDEWALALAGAGSFCFGVYFLAAPKTETISMLRWLGIYAGFSGVAILALAFRLHSLRTSVHGLAGHAVPASK
ncbi:MAG TPA: DUF308 domain-containing protein [Terriglobales bacterium]